MAPLKPLDKNLPIKPSGVVKTAKPRPVNALHVYKDGIGKRKAEESPMKRRTVKRSINDIALKENIVLTRARSSLTSKSTIPSNIFKGKAGVKDANEKVKLVNVPASKTKEKQAVIKEIDVTETTKPKPLGISARTNMCNPPVQSGIPRATKTVVKIETIKPPVKLLKPPVKATKTVKQAKEEPVKSGPVTRQAGRKSSDSDNSLYVTALEDVFHNRLHIVNSLNVSGKKSAKSEQKKKERKPPPGVEDFDLQQSSDFNSVATYAFDIFEYLKLREEDFKITEYISKQSGINEGMRAVLVDWFVDIQENFELNHETLYLSVKLLDTYLSKVATPRKHLQLIAASCILIASKYEERLPPSSFDMIELCDNLFTREDIIRMQMKLLKVVNFNLGFPLSYRFLRRYARCARIDNPLLTLARYILETSLMEYSLVTQSDSKVAAAALYLAMQMKKMGPWTSTLEYYSGYKLKDLKNIVVILNTMLHKKVKDNDTLVCTKTKYAHAVFYKVALVPLIDEINFDDTVSPKLSEK